MEEVLKKLENIEKKLEKLEERFDFHLEEYEELAECVYENARNLGKLRNRVL